MAASDPKFDFSIADLGKEMQKSYNFLMKKGVFPLTALL